MLHRTREFPSNTGMTPLPSRRQFLQTSLVAGAGLAFASSHVLAATSPNKRVVVAIIGLGGRGPQLIANFVALPNVHIKYLVDVDTRNFAKAATSVQKKSKLEVKTETDFRRVLDDKEVDAVIIATPDHWHAPMAILALKAGKHVYVEKPLSHNPHEGELVVAAAKKYGKVATLGTQRRSIAVTNEMIREIHGGLIGDVYYAQCFYSNKRAPIGFGKKVPPPAELNWDLWQGPAPRTAYRDNLHPYNWHWFWHWGTGECLNNAVHFLDVARWAMKVDYPTKVNSFGGRWHHVGVDDWEAPDLQEVQLEFGGKKAITWLGRSTSQYGPNHKTNGVIFYGSKGVIDHTTDGGYTLYDLDSKPVRSSFDANAKKVDATNRRDPGLKDRHAANFVGAIRGEEKLTAPVENGHISTMLAHLGNIAQRTGNALKVDPSNGHIIGDAAAQKLWSRDYERGWEPTI